MIKKAINPLQENMNKADYDDMRYKEQQDHEAMERAEKEWIIKKREYCIGFINYVSQNLLVKSLQIFIDFYLVLDRGNNG